MLPATLRQQLSLFCNSRIISTVPLFAGVPSQVCAAIVAQLQPRIFVPDDVGDLALTEMPAHLKDAYIVSLPAIDRVDRAMAKQAVSGTTIEGKRNDLLKAADFSALKLLRTPPALIPLGIRVRLISRIIAPFLVHDHVVIHHKAVFLVLVLALLIVIGDGGSHFV